LGSNNIKEVFKLAKKKTKNKLRTSNLILGLLGVFILTFIITMIVIFCKYQVVPDTLIQCVLGAGGLEALLLAAIKISKVIKGEEDING
jgi:hypothetical protein